MTMAAPTAPTAEQVRARTIASLERAAAELKAIDLRSLKGNAKEAVKDGRDAVADAIQYVKRA